MVAQHVEVVVRQVPAGRLDALVHLVRSAGVVSRRFACTHCLTAASQPTRLNTNTMAGSSQSRSSRSTTSSGLAARPADRCRPACGHRTCRRAPACPWASAVLHPAARPVVAGQPHELVVDRRSLLHEPGRHVDVGGREQVEQPLADRHVLVERHRAPLLHDGGGVAAHGLRHSPNSSAFDTVAESETSATDSGRWMITSSHRHPASGRRGSAPRPSPRSPGRGRASEAGVQMLRSTLGGHHDHRRLAVDAVVAAASRPTWSAP